MQPRANACPLFPSRSSGHREALVADWGVLRLRLSAAHAVRGGDVLCAVALAHHPHLVAVRLLLGALQPARERLALAQVVLGDVQRLSARAARNHPIPTLNQHSLSLCLQ